MPSKRQPLEVPSIAGRMQILGIETSCDDTAVALLDIQNREVTVQVNLVASQVSLHRPYGGVVPEVASRQHIETLGRLVMSALDQAKRTPDDLTAIAVTVTPGLIGALLVGIGFARSFAYALRIPSLPVHHLEGHIAAIYLEHADIVYPAVALVVSGGHTNIYHVRTKGRYEVMGTTRDDAAGEAFDKGARLLGYDYPGGPIIDQLAESGDPRHVSLPRPRVPGLDMSFSGLKTALRRCVAEGGATPVDLAAAYRLGIVDCLIDKTARAAIFAGAKSLLLVGGVAANRLLRQRIRETADALGIPAFMPSLPYCTDNAAMIAMAGWINLQTDTYGDIAVSSSPPTPPTTFSASTSVPTCLQ